MILQSKKGSPRIYKDLPHLLKKEQIKRRTAQEDVEVNMVTPNGC